MMEKEWRMKMKVSIKRILFVVSCVSQVLASRKYSAPDRMLPKQEPRLNKRAKQKPRTLSLEGLGNGRKRYDRLVKTFILRVGWDKGTPSGLCFSNMFFPPLPSPAYFPPKPVLLHFPLMPSQFSLKLFPCRSSLYFPISLLLFFGIATKTTAQCIAHSSPCILL